MPEDNQQNDEEKPAEDSKQEKASAQPEPQKDALTEKKLDTIKQILAMGEEDNAKLGNLDVVDSGESKEKPEQESGGDQSSQKFDFKDPKNWAKIGGVAAAVFLIIFIGIKTGDITGKSVDDDVVKEETDELEKPEENEQVEEKPEEETLTEAEPQTDEEETNEEGSEGFFSKLFKNSFWGGVNFRENPEQDIALDKSEEIETQKDDGSMEEDNTTDISEEVTDYFKKKLSGLFS